jgi:hypothetical protein
MVEVETDTVAGSQATTKLMTMMSILSALLCATCTAAFHSAVLAAAVERTGRPYIIKRDRILPGEHERLLGPTYFRRSYRMEYFQFAKLVQILKPYLPTKQRVGPNGTIPPEIEVSVALRFFAGGSPYDLMLTHGISHISVFNCIWRVVSAVNRCVDLRIRFPTDHEIQKKIAKALRAKVVLVLTFVWVASTAC